MVVNKSNNPHFEELLSKTRLMLVSGLSLPPQPTYMRLGVTSAGIRPVESRLRLVQRCVMVTSSTGGGV